MKRFGNTVVQWDLHTRQPKKVLSVPGVPLEIRFAWGANNNYAFTSTALTSKLHLIYEDDNGEWQAKAVADIGDPAANTFTGRYLDQRPMTRPCGSTPSWTAKRGCSISPIRMRRNRSTKRRSVSQINMVSQSWDGKARLFHLFAAGELGQERRRQRPVREGL